MNTVADTMICARLKNMDWKYSTPPMSPLHHDNRWCPIHNPAHKPH